MSFTHGVKLFLIALPFMFALDAVVLGVLAANFYKARLGAVANIVDGKLVFHYGPAIAAYVLLAVGLIVFVLPRVTAAGLPAEALARVGGSLITAFTYGALFGLVVYGVYDFTNAAVLKEWPRSLILVDTLWGAALTGATSTVLSKISAWLGS